MMVPVVQSVNRLCKARFIVWYSGAIDHTRVPLLNTRHRTARLDWAREQGDWRVEDCPDLYPIENLWYVLKQGMVVHHTASENLTELCTALANIWQVIPVERFQKLGESMPRRVAAIIEGQRRPNSLLDMYL
ncbi:uncharacterized protein TNCV_430841 [Trichonephila clavipes]|nr:uncharacterized protein TNCV_430841 [Trichonephila clavipes]